MLNQIFVAIDLEMTSAQPERQEIIELAAVKFRGDRVVETFSTLVNPRQAIPYNIQVLTGIKQDVVDRAPLLTEVSDKFIGFVKDLPLVAQSINLDLGCLQRKGIHLSNRNIDTFELASILLPQLPNYSLSALAAHLDVPITSQHRAAGDALMTGKVFQALLRRAIALDLPIIQEINRLTHGLDWPLRDLFRDIEREKGRTAFTGSSIRDQLAAKGGIEQATFDFMYLGRPRRQSLSPKEQREPIDLDQLASAFGPEGVFAQRLCGYEHRPEQATMARAVASAFNEGAHLVVEAGTGTGKSFAYLFPAVTFASANAARVVVSTNTINLQDQLFNKDIPDVLSATGLPFRTALVKGRANYLCPQRFTAMRRQQNLPPDEVLALVKVLVWLPTTTTGDVAELNLVEGQRLAWSKLHAPADSCLGVHCPSYKKGSCFVYRARDEAEGAHIVVVNHSLLLSDLFVSDKVLPEYRFLVIDEAHHFEDEATDQLSYRITHREVDEYLDHLSEHGAGDRRRGLLADLKQHLRGGMVTPNVEAELDERVKQLHAVVDRCRDSFQDMTAVLVDFVRSEEKPSRGYDSRLRLTPAVRSRAEWTGVEVAWERCAADLKEMWQGIDKIAAVLEQRVDSDVSAYEELLAELLAQAQKARDVYVHGTSIIARPDPARVAWIGMGQNRDVALSSAPLRVGVELQASLFGVKESVVMTSATLSTAGNFRYFRDRLGLTDCREAQVDSPFDYVQSTLLYVPSDIPEPDQPQYQRLAEQTIVDLCQEVGGRAMVLFTSYNQLNQTVKAVRNALEERRILVLAQEPGGRGPSRRKLLESFKQHGRAVLFGAASFWEGVDVVGDALSLLIIARLPFAVPTDPVVAARSEQYADPFREYSIPRSVLRLKQGFGRLIRSKSDRGIVVLLDRRVKTKSYGATFLDSLPRCTVKYAPLREARTSISDWLKSSPNGA